MADVGTIDWQALESFGNSNVNQGRADWTGLEAFLTSGINEGTLDWFGLEVFGNNTDDIGSTAWVGLEVWLNEEVPPPPPSLPPPVAIVLDLDTEIYSLPVNSYIPLTSSFHPEAAISGWIWDRKRVEDIRENFAQYLSTVGGHVVGLKDGTQKSYWQTGTMWGCGYNKLTHKYVHDYMTWTPQVSVGAYGLAFDERVLFSDYSYSSTFVNDQLENTLMIKQLREDAVTASIQVALFRRDTNWAIYKHYDFMPVDVFTGELSGAVRLDTETPSGEIIPANLSNRKYEFIVRDGKVVLNGNHFISNTFIPSTEFPIPPFGDLETLLEFHGANTENGRDIFLKFFPVQPGSIKVWASSVGNIAVELQETPSLSTSTPLDKHFQVDYDLGIITTGGYKAKNLVLRRDISDADTEIIVYPNKFILDSYPDKGIIVINNERIYYSEKTGYGFAGCIRGFEGTIFVNHIVGTEIRHQRMGDNVVGNLYVEYIAVPRIDYEVSAHNLRSANKSSWLDIRPISNVETENILQIYPGDISLNSILLETDSPLIGSNLYGPVFYGSDVSRLTATALDVRNSPVEDIDLTIKIIDGTGFLNGSEASYTDKTNTIGEIYSFYNHPLTREQIEFRVRAVQHVGADTVMRVSNLQGNLDLDDIWVFQILKHDKIIGTNGLGLTITGEGSAVVPYGRHYLDLDGFISDDYRDGLISIVVSGVKRYRKITWKEDLVDGNNVKYTRIYLESVIPSAIGSVVYLLEPDAVEWVPALRNGIRHILYEYSNQVLHPLTGEIGAYTPVRPDVINGNFLTFNDRHLPIPNPTSLSNNLGGYVIIAPGRVSIQAFGRDPMSARLVQSNIIRLALELPNYLTGVDSSGALPIPYGWKFPTAEHNIGGGLGGANFITINPETKSASQFALQIEV